jgi:hypothetical protein
VLIRNPDELKKRREREREQTNERTKEKSKSDSIVATYIFTAPTCTITIITSEPDYWETIISE